jgi:hypothetical protein
LIANELVSVQPMSLPSGLIFFLDFTFNESRLGNTTGESIYGGDKVAKGIADGVSLSLDNAEKSAYALNNGYASPTSSVVVATTIVASGTVAAGGVADFTTHTSGFSGVAGYDIARLLRFDADLVSGSIFAAATVPRATLAAADVNLEDYVALTITGSQLNTNNIQARRLTREDPTDSTKVLIIATSTTASTAAADITGLATALDAVQFLDAPLADNFNAGGAEGAVVGASEWGLENNAAIPEIDTRTKKLKAKWTPELGQDLNAYHNLDAEVELTSILSEQIALEIDREIMEDLLKGATAGKFYWSRSPGLFLDRESGAEIGASAAAPDFTGTVSEWYETLIETINDVSAQIHRKTLRGGANFVVCGPEVANILEFTAGFRANVTADADKGEIGAVKVGSLSRKFDVIVDPYFPRNVVLVGRKGGSFLESGYVYAPYVPLQVTPTIFGTEDFVPRKGVMTRYGKRMVRPDMYGLVIVRGLLGESGA